MSKHSELFDLQDLKVRKPSISSETSIPIDFEGRALDMVEGFKRKHVQCYLHGDKDQFLTMLIMDFASVTFVLKPKTKPSEELEYIYG